MKTLDFILPASNSALANEHETPGPRRATSKPAEPFDSLMNRALARPERAPGQKPLAAQKPVHESRASQTPKSEAGANRKAKPSARSEKDADAANVSSDQTKPEATVCEHAADDQEKNSPVSDSKPNPTESGASGSGDPADGTAALLPLVVSPAVDPAVNQVISQTSASGAVNGLTAILKAEPGGESPSATEGTAPPPLIGELVEENISQTGEGKPAADGKELSIAAGDPAKNSASADIAGTLTGVPDPAKSGKETPANIANAATDKPEPGVPDTTGTSGAKHPATMKHADTTAQNAGTPEQTLPGVTVIASAAQAAAHPKPVAKAVARAESSDSPIVANVSGADRSPSTSETSSSSQISASSQTEMRARALDRTHDIVALQGLRMKETNAGSLHVVIKPGAGLQLSLQLKQTGDSIEAQAILQQGDFKQLNQHWAELQQRLEERGIKLAPLGQDGSAMNTGGENFQRPSHQSAEQNSLSVGAFAEFASAGVSGSKSTPTPAVSSRGWEGWA